MVLNRLRVVAIVLLASVALGLIAFWFFNSQQPTLAQNEPRIFNDENILALYIREYGVSEAMDRLSQLAIEFGDCHNTAHEAGRISYEIYGSDAFGECSALCHSGCYHGAIEAYFKEKGTASIAEDLEELCSSDLNPFFLHQCLHGVGHGLMAWASYDLPEALQSCDLLSFGQSSCWSGVFMENIVGALSVKESENPNATWTTHVTEYLSDDPQYPCDVVGEQYKGTCYFLQTSRMLTLYRGDFAKVARACSEAPEAYQRLCFESMGRDIGGQYRHNAEGAIAQCAHSPAGSARIGCLNGAVQDSFWEPAGQTDALHFCALLSDRNEKTACYATIFERAPQILQTKKELQAFCAAIEPEFTDECAEKVL